MKRASGVVWVCVLLMALYGCANKATRGFSSSGATAGDSPGHVLNPADTEAPKFKVVTFEVVGKGLEPENAVTIGEAKLMAERAAVADGYRQLVEKIRGVYVDAFMKAGNGYVNYDVVQTHTQSWLRGTEVISISVAEHNITEARLQLRINFVYDQMIWWPIGLGTDFTPYWNTSSWFTPSPQSSRQASN